LLWLRAHALNWIRAQKVEHWLLSL
jgi:hypothetical protein